MTKYDFVSLILINFELKRNETSEGVPQQGIRNRKNAEEKRKGVMDEVKVKRYNIKLYSTI